MVAHLTMVRCVTIVIGMRYKMNFLDHNTNKWCHVIITENQLVNGDMGQAVAEKFDTPTMFTIYKIEAITE